MTATDTVTTVTLANTGTVIFAGGGTLNLAGTTPTITATAAAPSVVSLGAAIAMGAATTFSAVGTLSVTGIVSDGGVGNSLTKAGAGTVYLGGANTYAGGTTISAGTLSFNTIGLQGGAVANSLGEPSVANSTILYSAAATLLYVGTGSASSDRPITTTAALGGTFSEGSTGGILLSGPITANTGTFTFTNVAAGTGAVTYAGLLTSTAATALTKAGTNTLIITGNEAYTTLTSVSAGTLQIGNGATGGNAGSLAGGITDTTTVVFNRPDDFTFGSVITGALGNVTQAGNILTLKGASTYTGSTAVAAGELKAGVATVGTTSGPFGVPAAASNMSVAAGTLLDANGFAVTVGNLTGGGTVDDNSATAGTITVNEQTASTFSGTLADGTVSGSVLNFVKGGVAVLVMSNTVTDTRALANKTTVSAGVLDYAAPASFLGGTSATWTTSNFTVNLGATLGFYVGGPTDFQTTDLDYLQTVGSATGGYKAGALIGIDTTNDVGIFTYGSLIANSPAGALGVSKLGIGTLVLGNAANTFTGNPNIVGGTLQVSSIPTGTATPSQLGQSGTILFSNVTQAFLDVIGAGNTTDWSFNVANSAGGNGTILADGSGPLVLSGTAALTGGATTHSIILGGPGIGSITGNITATIVGLTKQDAGTWTLSGTNAYTGATNVIAGTLVAGIGAAGGSLSTGAAGNTLTISGVLIMNRSTAFTQTGIITGAGTLIQQGPAAVVLAGANAFTGATTISAGVLQVGAGGTAGVLGTGIVTDNGSLVFNRTDAITVPANITGSGSLTQSGTGTVLLTGTNSYAGITTVAAGTLQFGKEVSLYNNVPASWIASNIIVNSGATLSFNVGGTGEFTPTDIATLSALGSATGGFLGGSKLGLDSTNATAPVTISANLVDTNGGGNRLHQARRRHGHAFGCQLVFRPHHRLGRHAGGDQLHQPRRDGGGHHRPGRRYARRASSAERNHLPRRRLDHERRLDQHHHPRDLDCQHRLDRRSRQPDLQLRHHGSVQSLEDRDRHRSVRGAADLRHRGDALDDDHRRHAADGDRQRPADGKHRQHRQQHDRHRQPRSANEQPDAGRPHRLLEQHHGRHHQHRHRRDSDGQRQRDPRLEHQRRRRHQGDVHRRRKPRDDRRDLPGRRRHRHHERGHHDRRHDRPRFDDRHGDDRLPRRQHRAERRQRRRHQHAVAGAQQHHQDPVALGRRRRRHEQHRHHESERRHQRHRRRHHQRRNVLDDVDPHCPLQRCHPVGRRRHRRHRCRFAAMPTRSTAGRTMNMINSRHGSTGTNPTAPRSTCPASATRRT